jgi:hypothetical protein
LDVQNKNSSPRLTWQWFDRVKQRLDQELEELSVAELELLDEKQQFDLIITRQWLRMLLWEIAIREIFKYGNSGCLIVECPMTTSHCL